MVRFFIETIKNYNDKSREILESNRMKTKLCDSPTFLPPSPLLSLFNYANGRVPQPGERCTSPLFLRSPSWPMTAKTRPAHCCQLQCGPLPPREERRGGEQSASVTAVLRIDCTPRDDHR